MKKRILAVLLVGAMCMGLIGCRSKEEAAEAGATGSESLSEAVADFNPDEEEDSMTIEELREKNGIEVGVSSGVKLGAVEKSLSNEYWRTLQEGYEEAEKVVGKTAEISIKIDGTTDESDETGQQAMTENMITENCDAILLSPISDSNLTSAVENAKKKDVMVMNVNDGLIADADYFVGPNAYQNGELAAEWISKQLGDTGEVAIVVGIAKAFAARQRTAGFKDWIENNNSGLEVVAEQNGDWDRQKSKELAATWIQQNPELKAIFCNNDTMALGVVEAVKEANADILVVGVDGIGEAYDSIRAGGLSATVDSFPFFKAQVAVECALRALDGQEVPRVVATPQALIDSNNVDKDAAEIIGWEDATYVEK
ncbi:ribose transport system substrate-binding protein [Lachnospiraceae bacterium PF1-21]